MCHIFIIENRYFKYKYIYGINYVNSFAQKVKFFSCLISSTEAHAQKTKRWIVGVVQ